MSVFVLLSTILALGWVVYEDLRYRAVTWWWFPVLFLVLSASSLQVVPWQVWWPILLVNIGFVGIQLVFVSLYISIKHRRWILLTNGFLGLGDVLFFLCFCGAMSTPIFVVFYITSLLGSLLLAACVSSLREKGIPLAGLQAFFLAVLLAYAHIQGFCLIEEQNYLPLVLNDLFLP